MNNQMCVWVAVVPNSKWDPVKRVFVEGLKSPYGQRTTINVYSTKGRAQAAAGKNGRAVRAILSLETESVPELTLATLCEIAYDQAKEKGFHPDGDKTTFGDRCALVHTEVSEALEAYRSSGDPSCNFPRSEPTGKPEGVPSELADVVIRVADMSKCYGIDLEAAVKEKLAYNKTRPYKHGKKVY